MDKLFDTRPVLSSSSESDSDLEKDIDTLDADINILDDFDPEAQDFENTIGVSMQKVDGGRDHMHGISLSNDKLDDYEAKLSRAAYKSAPELENEEKSFHYPATDVDVTATSTDKNTLIQKLSEIKMSSANQIEIIAKNSIDEVERGKMLRKQLSVWQEAVDLRISMQTALETSHNLPCALKYDFAAENFGEINKVLENLVSLFDSITCNAKEGLEAKKRSFINVDEIEGELSEIDRNISATWKSSLDFWNQKVNLSTASIKSSKSTLKIIDQSLWNWVHNALKDKSHLLKQTKKLKQSQENQKATGHIYNDADFFGVLVGDWIGSKQSTNNKTSALAGNSKKPSKVDRGASKGRRIRYVVHDKLVGFMVPDGPKTGWDDSKIDNFFADIFVQ